MNEKLMYNIVIKKIKIQYTLKKVLVKTIIIFTSISFESYCQIPAPANNETIL